MMRRNNKGSTLVEVLVAFTVMMILMAGFVKIINLSSKLFLSAKEIELEENAINSVAYLEAPVSNGATVVGDDENPRVYAFVEDDLYIRMTLDDTMSSPASYSGSDKGYSFYAGPITLVSYLGKREGTLIYRFR